MSPHLRIRTIVVAGSAALLLAPGSGPLTVTAASAAPIVGMPAQAPQYPLSPNPGTPGQPGQPPKEDKTVEKAESLGSGIMTKAIDTTAGLLKCGLGFALPSMKCNI
ncbi:hypothetical protein [Nocardia sp. NPDC127526]|uniref:hypothetical protein n=1 Tax=Nocardia sp. NPDC127526 TaxID=3345393 RepID=UPI003633AEED